MRPGRFFFRNRQNKKSPDTSSPLGEILDDQRVLASGVSETVTMVFRMARNIRVILDRLAVNASGGWGVRLTLNRSEQNITIWKSYNHDKSML